MNHTVDTEDEPEIDTTADKPDVGEMRSKPRFEVDLVRGDQTVSFTCSFLEEPAQEGEYGKPWFNDFHPTFKMVLTLLEQKSF